MIRVVAFVAGVGGAALMAYLGAPWWVPTALVTLTLIWGAIDVWCWLREHRDDPPDDPDDDEMIRSAW